MNVIAATAIRKQKMTGFFVIRTADDEKEWIWREIQQGRLRQGWGLSNTRLPSGEHAPDKMDDWCLRYRKEGEQFWKENIPQEQAESRYWILRQMLEIQTGDRIVIPKMPTWGSFCIALVKEPYEFDTSKRADPDDDDFRHVVPLQSELRIVPHLSSADAQIVAASLKGYQAAVSAVYKASVRNAIEAIINTQSTTTSGDVAALFREVGKAATEKIVDELMNKLAGLQPNVFEQFIREMLKLGGYRILKTNQYDGEGGDADLIAEAEMPPLAAAFEQQSILLMQIKKKSGIDYDDVQAINQLARMAQTYPGAVLVVVSTADKFTDACLSAAKDRRVVLINGRTLARLLLRYMP
jgi:HJR/Mrr/RecB family endonuclease